MLQAAEESHVDKTIKKRHEICAERTLSNS